MYKVIIADDEKSIQNGIRNYINHIGNFYVEQCFDSGNDVIEYLKSNDADVVITDIRMDNGTGIDVVKYIYENKRYIKTVIISAYEEMEYVRAAIKYNVEGFVSKPTRYSEFESVMNKIYNEFETENKQSIKAKTYESYNNCLIEILYNCILNDRKIMKDDINNLMMIMYDGNHKQVVNSKYCVFSVEIKNYDDFIDNKWNYGSSELSELLKNFISSALAPTEDKIRFYQTDFNDNIVRYIAQSSKYESISDMSDDLEKYIKIAAVTLRDEVGISAEIKITDKFNDINALVSKGDISVINSSAYDKRTIEQAISFINEHYSDDISLHTISKHVNMNSAYFSHFFKKHTGQNFSDFLLDLRMTKAKEMILSGNFKIEEICKNIGYKSMSYFCKTFKNITGYTPRQFYILGNSGSDSQSGKE